MSNVTPRQIAYFTAEVYEIEKGDFRTHSEAAGAVGYLTLKHTLSTVRMAGIAMQIPVAGSYHVKLQRLIAVYSARVEENPDTAAKMEAIEAKIDRAHDIAPPVKIDKRRRSIPKPRYSRKKPVTHIGSGELSDDWYRLNNENFRRGFKIAAE